MEALCFLNYVKPFRICTELLFLFIKQTMIVEQKRVKYHNVKLSLKPLD